MNKAKAQAQRTSTVSEGTYVGFIVLTACGDGLAWFLVDAKIVVRNKGSYHSHGEPNMEI